MKENRKREIPLVGFQCTENIPDLSNPHEHGKYQLMANHQGNGVVPESTKISPFLEVIHLHAHYLISCTEDQDRGENTWFLDSLAT